MINLLLVGFYEPKEHILDIVESLENVKFNVLCYPLFKYAYDIHDKIQNYEEHFFKYIETNNIHIILWIFIDININLFINMKKRYRDKPVILFNIDDPVNYSEDICNKLKYVDIYLSSCATAKQLYQNFISENNVHFCPLGYNSKIFNAIDNNNAIDTDNKLQKEKYTCDMSMVVRNFQKIINKKKIVDDIIDYANNKKITFHIYGCYLLNEIFPQNYKGNVSYADLKYLFNYSKINIVLHDVNDKGLYYGLDELIILGCGGLLVTDKLCGSEYTEETTILLTDNNYVNDIDDAFKNPSIIETIRKNGNNFAEKYEISNWAKKFKLIVMKRLFDEHSYKMYYNISDGINLWEDWVSNYDEHRICHKLEVPCNFDYDSYKNYAKIWDNNDIDFAYFHWLVNSNSKLFIKKTNNNDISYKFEDYNVLPSDIMFIDKILMDIYNGKNYIKNIHKLKKYIETVPYIKINNVIGQFINKLS